MKIIKDGISFLAFGCTHCPMIDPVAEDGLINVILSSSPDYIICLGDLHEADSASRWPSEYDFTLEDELRDVNRFLKRIRKASPSSKKVFLPGNHDANLTALNRINRKIRGLVDYRRPQYSESGDYINEELVEHWSKPTQHIYSFNNVFRIGQVGFVHGFETSNHGLKRQCVSLTHEYGLLVHAHTHRPTEYPQRVHMGVNTPLNYWYADAGCIRDLKPAYVERKNIECWSHGCVYGEVKVTKSPRYKRMWEAFNIKL